jgi:hypothetical protein
MPLASLPTFDVPAVDAMPETDDPRRFDVVGCLDFLLTQLLRHGAGLLHSEFRDDEGRWRLLTWSTEGYRPEEVIAVTAQKAHFRAVLAHLGTRFLSGQIHGGFAEGFFTQRGASHYFALYTANDQLRGYWLRLYARAAQPNTALDRPAERSRDSKAGS